MASLSVKQKVCVDGCICVCDGCWLGVCVCVCVCVCVWGGGDLCDAHGLCVRGTQRGGVVVCVLCCVCDVWGLVCVFFWCGGGVLAAYIGVCVRRDAHVCVCVCVCVWCR